MSIRIPSVNNKIILFNGKIIKNTADQEEKDVELSFTNGKQEVYPSDTKTLNKVNILQPDTLIPENIRSGVDIAGITGTLGTEDIINGILNRTINIENISSTVELLGDCIFYNAVHLTSINFPKVKKINLYAFYNCQGLTTAAFPVCEEIGQAAFFQCTNLQRMDAGITNKITGMAFSTCQKLDTLILRNNILCVLQDKNAFTNTPIASGTGSIYVPATLLEDYKAATNWSVYSTCFKAIEDYPDVVGG